MNRIKLLYVPKLFFGRIKCYKSYVIDKVFDN